MVGTSTSPPRIVLHGVHLFQTYYLAVDALVLMLDISSGRTPSEPAKFESAIAQDVEGVRNFLCKFDDWEACPLLILCHATDTESVAFDAERIRGEIGKCELRRLPNRALSPLLLLLGSVIGLALELCFSYEGRLC